MRRPAPAAAIVILGALLFCGSAQACSCVDRTPRQALEVSDAAVAARLLEMVRHDGYVADYRYLVRRVYKRSRGDGLRRGVRIAVRSGSGGALCGLPAAEGRLYGLFLDRSGGRWRGSLCAMALPSEISAAAVARRRGNREGAHALSSCDA